MGYYKKILKGHTMKRLMVLILILTISLAGCIEVPEVDDSQTIDPDTLEMPSVQTPKLKLPEIKLPKLKLPDIKLPEINLPSLKKN